MLFDSALNLQFACIERKQSSQPELPSKDVLMIYNDINVI